MQASSCGLDPGAYYAYTCSRPRAAAAAAAVWNKPRDQRLDIGGWLFACNVIRSQPAVAVHVRCVSNHLLTTAQHHQYR